MRALFRRASIIASPSSGSRDGGASSSDGPAASADSSSRYAQPEDVSYAEAAARRGIAHSTTDGGGGIGGMPTGDASAAAAAASGSRNAASQLTMRERSKRKAEQASKSVDEPMESKGILLKRRSSRLTSPPPSSYNYAGEGTVDPALDARTWRSARPSVDDDAPLYVMGASADAQGYLRPGTPDAARGLRIASSSSATSSIATAPRSPRQAIVMSDDAAGTGSVGSSSGFLRSPSAMSKRKESKKAHLANLFTPANEAEQSSQHLQVAPLPSPHPSSNGSVSPSMSRFGSLSRGRRHASASSSSQQGLSSPFSPSGSGFSPMPSPIASTSPQADDGTASLAQRLNELAIAHGDGLLGEEEYRTLRAAVFDSVDKSKLEVPREEAIAGYGAAAIAVRQVSRTEPREASQSSAPPASVKSHRSSFQTMASLFRRSSILRSSSAAPTQGRSSTPAPAAPSSWASHAALRPASAAGSYKSPPAHGVLGSSESSRSAPRSLWGSVTSGSLRRSQRTAVRTALAAELEQDVHNARANRTMRGYSSLGTRTDPGDEEFGGAGRPNSALSADDSAGSAVGNFGASGMLGTEYAEKGSAELRAEIAIVEAEGKRLLESFVGLEQTALGRYTLDHDQLKRAYAASLRFRAGQHLHTVASQPALRGGLAPGSVNGRGSRSSGNLLAAPSPPGAFQRSASGLTVSSTGSGASDETTTESHHVEADINALATELADIAARREDVRNRYEDRTAFLRSKLRSATIREGLRR